MSSPARFSIEWQRQSQLDAGSAHSILISLLRGLAAFEVAAAHLRAEVFPGLREISDPHLAYQLLAFVTGFAHQAVVVFFLISGMLVGGSLLNKLGGGAAKPLRDYAIDRITRLWTVLVPALLLMLAVGALTGDLGAGGTDAGAANAYSAAAFAGNLVGLQTVLVENFGGNYALWSLANETWYYVAFPLLLLVFLPGSRLRQVAAATALIVLAGALPFPITLYFALWLLGALFSRVRITCRPGVRMAFVAATLVASVCFRLSGSTGDMSPDAFAYHVVVSLPLLALLSSLQTPLALGTPLSRGIARLGHWLSEFSFTLYVTHIPLIKLMRHVGEQEFGRSRLDPNVPLDYAIYAGMLASLVGAAYLSYLLFEAHTFRIRRLVKSLLQRRAQRQPLVAVRSK